MRTTIRDHLHAFKNYSQHNVFYINLWWFRQIPRYIQRIPFDLIVYHTYLLAPRWVREVFQKVVAKLEPLRDHASVSIALPQDEYIHTELLESFYNRYVDHIFTLSPLSEVEKIYPGVDRARISFHRVLPGYLDERTLREIERMKVPKDIDLGYRARPGLPWRGRWNLKKGEIADAFSRACVDTPLKCDISTRDEDVFVGLSWYQFLKRCKYTIGIEGGATILDNDGSLKLSVEAYMEAHPGASYEEVEAACFPGRDGEVRYVAISPRHLEACATRTCQFLVEGDYNGILLPWVHYIPVKSDLSDIDEAVKVMIDDKIREGMVEQAYQDIVHSGKYTYAGFVGEIFDQVWPNGPPVTETRTFSLLRLRTSQTLRAVFGYVPFQILTWLYLMAKKSRRLNRPARRIKDLLLGRQ